MLRGRIVQLLGDDPPLLDLQHQQPFGKVADLLLHPVLLGDILGNAEDELDLALHRRG